MISLTPQPSVQAPSPFETTPDERTGKNRFMGWFAGKKGGERRKGRIVQLRWQEGFVFIYDSQTLEQISDGTFSTALNEGWDITAR